MLNVRRNCRKRGLCAVFAALICLFMLFSLAACNENKSVSAVRYGLYLAGADYDDETLVVTAYVSVSGTEEQRLEGVVLKGQRTFESEGLFYNRIEISVSLDVPAIYDAVKERVALVRPAPDDGDGSDKSVQYQSLQVAMRYATIYKSVVTNGARRPSGSGYVDILPLEGEGAQEFKISQRAQNSANQYTLLVAAGIALFAAIMGVYIAYLHRKEKALPQEGTYAEKE